MEYLGEYGAVTVAERVVQLIWQRQAFAGRELKTLGGKQVRVRDPGRWNHHEGPDFREAELMLDGRRVRGDVEVHFYPQDWFLHGHDRNANFDRVVLHVCLFPPRRELAEEAACPETLILLEHLSQDLESYANEEALLALEGRANPEARERYGLGALEERLEQLQSAAQLRWRQKAAFARRRLSLTDWEQACHQYALEVLGYRRNREPMGNLALRFPLNEMAGQTVETLYGAQADKWRLSGQRPANHPRKRLEQYVRFLRQRPRWPQDLLDWWMGTPAWPARCEDTGRMRREYLLPVRKVLAGQLFADCIGGTRLDTLVVDALLPLLACKTGADLFTGWFHWWVGDMPASLAPLLRETDILGPGRPAANGWMQGAWQQWLESGLCSV